MRWLVVAAFAACHATPAPSPRDPEVEALVAHIDDNADELHADMTPAVEQLGLRGRGVILDLPLDAAAPMTRLHAQRALQRVVERHFGFVPGQGWMPPDGEERFRALWKQNGDYDANAPEPARARSIAAWRAWAKLRD